MTDLGITRADRQEAWPFRPSCYTEQARPFWLDGEYDICAPVIQAFARHRQSHSLPGVVGTVRADLEDLLDDIEDEWIDHYLRPDSAERAKCKRCGGDDFFKRSIEHKPGCLVGRIRAALTPSALSGDAALKKGED